MPQQLINLLHTEAIFLRAIHQTNRPEYLARFIAAARDLRGQINQLQAVL